MNVKLDTAPRVKGLSAIRAAMAMGLAKGRPGAAERVAEDRWGEASAPAVHLKSAATLADVSGGGASVPLEFFEAAIERSALGRLAGLRRVIFKHRVVSMNDGTQAHWLAEGDPVPISKAALDFETLEPLAVGAMTVATQEALEFGGAAIEAGLRGDLLRALAKEINAAAFDPANAGILDGKPASLTHDAPGATAADWLEAREVLLADFTGDLETAYLVMSPRTAIRAGASDRPNIGARGGDIWGIPAATGTGIPDGIIALVDPALVAFAASGGDVRVSTEASVQFGDPVTGATELVSLWQTNSVILGASAWTNWQAVREGAVTYVAIFGEPWE